MSLPDTLKSRMRLPLIAAPMFLVSGPALVKAACRAGVIGSFPTANCRSVEELDGWLADMSDDLERPYEPKEVEERWYAFWEKEGVFGQGLRPRGHGGGPGQRPVAERGGWRGR